MSIPVLVGIIGWDGLSPACSAFEVNVFNVGSRVNNVNVNTLTRVFGVEVLVEVAEGQRVSVRNTSEAPWGVLFKLPRVVAAA